MDLGLYGLSGLGLVIPSPSFREERDSFPGLDGEILLGRDLEPREIEAPFFISAADYPDSLMLRDVLYQLFSEVDYIGEVQQPGKWWKVRLVDEFKPERINPRTFRADIPFYCESGKAESLGSTGDALEWDVDKWQWGMGLTPEEYSYEHNTSRFFIYNAGAVEVNPRKMPLEISLTGIASDYVEIINHTTNDVFRYEGALNSSNTLKLTGIRSLIDNLSVLRQTNKKLITLAPGANDIEVKGVDVERIFFEFKFYYL
ncbi:phage tail family protein [Planococcus rifietoensis]|uniref:phage tail family protein n=1 Tax=Planococcus rifietoensis TaxID=200991 RepID=UPI00384A7F54